MRSFDEIVDELWKPGKFAASMRLDGRMDSIFTPCKKHSDQTINHLAWYSEQLSVPFYGRDVQEPVVKICKRILEKPNRFHLVKDEVHNYVRTYALGAAENIITRGWIVIQDKDTQQKFTRSNPMEFIGYPSCFTLDEKILLTAVLDEWYVPLKESFDQKEKSREKKRKERFRNELSDLYKEY